MNKKVLNAGCGPKLPDRLQSAFRDGSWQEVRMDLVGSLTDMDQIPDRSFDAVWCSHTLEHLHTHQVPHAIRSIRRVLNPDGFALVTSPDLEPIAALISEGRGEDVAYQSPMGPITALDMLFGHGASIERGNFYMAHKTGFTADSMARHFLASGFVEVLVTKGNCFDIWALALMPSADKDTIVSDLARHGLDFNE
jgi:predicted SAM-dependent methyltransferase